MDFQTLLQVAQQRCHMLRRMYIAHILNFEVNMFIWLDETGTDKQDQLRKYGYAIRGVTPHYHRLLTRGQRINACLYGRSSGIGIGEWEC